MPQIFPRIRGDRRSRNPVDGLYFQYRRPETVAAVCTRCGTSFSFKADLTKTHEFDEKSREYLVLRGEVEADLGI